MVKSLTISGFLLCLPQAYTLSVLWEGLCRQREVRGGLRRARWGAMPMHKVSLQSTVYLLMKDLSH